MVYYFFFSFPQPKRKFKEIQITCYGGFFGSGGLFVKFGFRGGGLFGRGFIREWGLSRSFTVTLFIPEFLDFKIPGGAQSGELPRTQPTFQRRINVVST